MGFSFIVPLEELIVPGSHRSSLASIPYVEMVTEPVVPQGAFRHAAPFQGRSEIHPAVYPRDNGNFFLHQKVFMISGLFRSH